MVWWTPEDGFHEFHTLRHYIFLSTLLFCLCSSPRTCSFVFRLRSRMAQEFRSHESILHH